MIRPFDSKFKMPDTTSPLSSPPHRNSNSTKQIQTPTKMVPRKTPKILEQEEEESMMKRVIHTPNSSVKSSATTDLYNNPSETRDSFYFPGCRKDANCCCDICIESINATLDLVQESRHSFLTRRIPSPSRTRLVSRTPVTFDSSSADLSTPVPIPKIRPVADSPPLKSTARMNFEGNVKRENSHFGRNWVFVRRVLLVLVLVFVMEYGISWLVCRVSRSNFSTDLVNDLALKSRGFENLNGKFVFLKKELEWYAGKKIATCTSADAVWKINQDGLLLNSRCVLYKSMTEEVSIWGWPLQTAGLLTAECASRSLTIISGRVTEWSHEDAKYLIREANSTWEQGKWSSSVVQFDPNTWILEYKRGFLADNPRPTSAVVKLLKARVRRGFEKMRRKSSLLSSFVNLYSAFTDRSILTPT